MAKSRAKAIPAKNERRADGRQSADQLLDQLLPLAIPAQVEIHHGAAIVEVAEPSQLLELVSDVSLRPYLLCRLAENVALVDAGRASELVDALKRRGHTPKLQNP